MMHDRNYEKQIDLDGKNAKPDMVNNPPHYNKGGLEAIQVIKMALTREEYKGYLKGNVLKYKLRAPYKGKEDEDHEKANWYYVEHEMEFLDGYSD